MVLEEIGRQLGLTLDNDESSVAASAQNLSPQELAELEAQVQAQGHKFYGVFADDPGALDVFDEIERLRDQQPLTTSPMPAAP